MGKKHKPQRNYQPPRPFVAAPKPITTPEAPQAPQAAEAAPAVPVSPVSSLGALTAEAIAAIDGAIAAAQKLAEARTAENLSVSRVAGVKRELAELRKFLAIYAV